MTIQLATEIDGKKVGFQTGSRGIEPERSTVLFIHGSGGARASWHCQMKPLDSAINVIALELPGHGQTPGPLLPTVAEMTTWVAAVVEAWNLPKQRIVAGHSLGGAIAIELGLTRPDLFSGLILIGTGARLAVNPAIIDGLFQDFKGTVGLAVKWSYHKNTDPALLKAAAHQLSLNRPETLANDFRACDLFDRREEVQRINLPTLIICGQQEKMTPPALSEFLAEKIPGARLALIDQAGHMVIEEQAEKVNQIILEFVGDMSLQP